MANNDILYRKIKWLKTLNGCGDYIPFLNGCLRWLDSGETRLTGNQAVRLEACEQRLIERQLGRKMLREQRRSAKQQRFVKACEKRS